MEAIGVCPSRTQVKRRKASGAGKLACSNDARYLLVFRVYWRRDGRKVCVFYPGRSAGLQRALVGPRTKDEG